MGDGYDALITADMGSTGNEDFCNGSVNDKYNWSDGKDTYKDATCIDGGALFDDEADVGVGQLFLPTLIQESFQERASGGGCTALASSCTSTGTDFADGVPGAKKFTAASGSGPNPTHCTCEQNPKTYYAAGVTGKIIELNHVISVESPTAVAQSSYAHKTDNAHRGEGVAELFTMMMTYNKKQSVWLEASCPTSLYTQKSGECRFGNGNVPNMSVGDWLNAGNVFGLDSRNAESGMGNNPLAGKEAIPPFRISGVELVVQF